MVPLAKMVSRAFRGSRLAFLLLVAFASAEVAAAGRICISNDTFMFGNRAIGSSTTATATVTNCGNASWSFTDVSVHQATGPAFHVSATCTTGLTLAPGETCTVGVAFAPATPGQTSGAVWLRNTTTTPDQLITFYGRGVDATTGSASLAFSPSSANFPAQAVGSQSDALSIQLHNLGPAALTLSALVINGPQVYDFLGFNNGCQVGSTIPAGAFCEMALYFRPQARGTRLANLVVDSPQLASLAIMQMSGTASSTPAATVDVVEFYNAAMDHYFMSALAADIGALDTGRFSGWVRSGRTFKAYPQPAAGASPVCRFYLPLPLDSHFYSASALECADVAAKYPSFVLEAPDVFYIALPDTMSGACPPATVPVFRLYNNRADANHRYTTDAQIKAQMVARGYIAEGYGSNAAIMCAPQ